jgi:hypothetical protein
MISETFCYYAVLKFSNTPPFTKSSAIIRGRANDGERKRAGERIRQGECVKRPNTRLDRPGSSWRPDLCLMVT